MKVIITGKGYNPSEQLEETIEKKLTKLGKYFSDEINANVVISKFKGKTKVEITINGHKAIFRAEETSDNVYEAVDIIVDKLSNQMSKFKGKLQKRYNDNKSLKLEFVPEVEDEESRFEANVVKRKRFQLNPMNIDEAILQMEMLQHDFFVYMDMDTETVNVVYKRKDDHYGVLETTY
ncbi:MAG TPA: ribosome-associated translation inhibitor RaiA [Anaerovoracaceae bacterium]|nr:ribosome-associated translation inhibitor RaiA [Anaerovoracaceae bacterium]